MNKFDEVKNKLKKEPKVWLVTGAAGFIGSHLVENLLSLNQKVVGLDNFATGSPENISLVLDIVGEKKAANFSFIEGDIRDIATCQKACKDVEYVLHQAALGSVPRSIKDPLTTHSTNVDGFLNMLLASRDVGVKRFVFASSSSVYGDSAILPKVEAQIGTPLSPYALSKRMDEEIAKVYSNVYDLKTVGLRYFNVFGPRQDPNGPYAAVMPLWFKALTKGEVPVIYGDGETSRDFCFVANVVQANILAAVSEETIEGTPWGQVYNIACGDKTTLNDLFCFIKNNLIKRGIFAEAIEPRYEDFRAGDIRHSTAEIKKAQMFLGYNPEYKIQEGLEKSSDWYSKLID